jgi:hypothetical protein
MAKSPVYGRGRNRNHKPHGAQNHPAAANINMRGRKTKLESCWCCVCIDMRDDMIKKIHAKEMRNALVGQLVESAVSKSA